MVLEFLAGLNVEFDSVRVELLNKDVTSPLKEVTSLIVAEERKERGNNTRCYPSWKEQSQSSPTKI